jgi:hypothetical protein
MNRLIIISFVFSGAVFATNSSVLKFAAIKSLEDGSFGAKRLYYNLACNQEFVQVLESGTGSNTVDVGILTRWRDESCDSPSRRVFTRYNPYGRVVSPVHGFEAVWYCEATCFTPGGPDMPPYNRFVSSFGTSEKQATEYLGCTPPYLQHLSCHTVAVQ